MTLVIINKYDKKMSFSADTRISFGEQGFFDKTIKIFRVPCRIKGLSTSVETISKYEFEYDYGLSVVGNTINAFTIKDSISELLFNIQYISNISDKSIIGISELVLKVYEKVSIEICSLLRKTGICEIILGGFCIVEKKIRIIRFYPKLESNLQTFHFEEILKSDGQEMYGSGKSLAIKIFDKNRQLSPLKIIKKVIEDTTVNSVGGSVQQGIFGADNNFHILAINDKHNLDAQISLHGFPFLQNDFITKYPYLYVTYHYSNELNE